jgi:hypothetical protein
MRASLRGLKSYIVLWNWDGCPGGDNWNPDPQLKLETPRYPLAACHTAEEAGRLVVF